eukprot:TRINITY_DN11837_c0_g1_i3.p1 TRINITY_DN11837_c0_g1~~TRINITY_DN11837_c0_g1_i3.p1  ORF type:complete len:327 (+),score=76.05 TRINITY_DN11837_c0_g1_i3:155-1135(+)
MATKLNFNILMERNADKREANLQYEKGVTAFKEGNYKEAADYFEDAARILENYNFVYALALTYSKLQENKKAMEAYVRVYGLVDKEVAAAEKRVKILVYIAREAGALKKIKEAEAYLEKALEVLPLVKDKGREQELREDIVNQKRMLPSMEKVTKKNLMVEAFEKGKAMEERRSYDEAIEEYTKSLEIKETALATFRRALCYQELGRFEEAVEGYARYLKFRGELEQTQISNCYFNLGVCYLELGDYENACTIYSNILKSTYNVSRKSKALKYLQVANERKEVCWILKVDAQKSCEQGAGERSQSTGGDSKGREESCGAVECTGEK